MTHKSLRRAIKECDWGTVYDLVLPLVKTSVNYPGDDINTGARLSDWLVEGTYDGTETPELLAAEYDRVD